MTNNVNVFWFRRDLRLNDNHALSEALRSSLPVLCIFIFDTNILDRLSEKADKRVSFIYEQIEKLNEELEKHGSRIFSFYGSPVQVFSDLSGKWTIDTVFANEDYEPESIARDKKVAANLSEKNITFSLFKDQVIFAKDDILKPNGEPYTIFTPYSKKWLEKFSQIIMQPFPVSTENLLKARPEKIIPLEEMGFTLSDPGVLPLKVDRETMHNYGTDRNKPALDATSHASVHLRFGTISIRALAKKASDHSAIFLSELIWREFFQSILYHFPRVAAGYSFKPAYDNIQWRNNEDEFEKWCEGRTGYPIVDAGMRQLKQTGFLHNRVRMITASFLCKHLLIDWRWGESWFAQYLLDFELASNNGNWQWASGSGCDSTPYFRIFNPYIQQKKFDPAFSYVRKWVPEFQSGDYPPPLVEHDFARKRCLEVYSEALNERKA